MIGLDMIRLEMIRLEMIGLDMIGLEVIELEMIGLEMIVNPNKNKQRLFLPKIQKMSLFRSHSQHKNMVLDKEF